MRFCNHHWDMMRLETVRLGIDQYVSANGDVLGMRMVAELQGADDRDSFDPLMRAHNMIMMRTMDMVGLSCMAEDFGCPICFFNTQRNEDGSCVCNDPACPNKAPGSIGNFEAWVYGDISALASIKEMMAEKGWLDD